MEKVRGTGKVIDNNNFLPRVTVLQRFLFPVLLAVMLIAGGCVTTEEAAENRSTLGQLQVQVGNLEKDMTMIKEQTSGISVVKENQTNLLSQTADLSKEVQALKGRFDENKYFQDKTLKDILSEIELLKARIASLESPTKDSGRMRPSDIRSGSRRAGAAEAEGKQPEVKTKEPDSAAKIYDEAHILLKEKKYAQARKMFERFIKDYPKEGLAANAYFWIGETFYSEKKYEDAILAYEDFVRKYRKHDKAKSALLKQAYSFLALGGKNNRLAGKDILENLMEKYPKSKEADLAKKKLKEISKPAPAQKSRKRT
jgi:tol-pal system protein YbgF